MFLEIGIILMVACAVLSVICLVIFMIKTKKLKNILEQEYGKPKHERD